MTRTRGAVTARSVSASRPRPREPARLTRSRELRRDHPFMVTMGRAVCSQNVPMRISIRHSLVCAAPAARGSRPARSSPAPRFARGVAKPQPVVCEADHGATAKPKRKKAGTHSAWSIKQAARSTPRRSPPGRRQATARSRPADDAAAPARAPPRRLRPPRRLGHAGRARVARLGLADGRPHGRPDPRAGRPGDPGRRRAREAADPRDRLRHRSAAALASRAGDRSHRPVADQGVRARRSRRPGSASSASRRRHLRRRRLAGQGRPAPRRRRQTLRAARSPRSSRRRAARPRPGPRASPARASASPSSTAASRPARPTSAAASSQVKLAGPERLD